MMSAAWEDRPGAADHDVRSIAASSGRRLAPLVYDMVKDELLGGNYTAGERLAVEKLKARLGVSKQPIMDALRRLASDGLVEIIPQVGCRVPVYDEQDVADFFAIFGGLEGAVAAVAAQRRVPGQLDELIAVNTRIGLLADDSDPAARARGYRLLNRSFHAVVHDMAHSPVVAGISRRMWDMSDLLISTSGIPQPLAFAVPARHDDHDRIIIAIRDRDQFRARAEMEAHIVGTIPLIHTESRYQQAGEQDAGPGSRRRSDAR
jgi:DNA-binding GntR family transcriptional regulator